MVDINKAHSVNDGIYVDENFNGPFFTGGASSPVGQGLPFNTFYIQTFPSGQHRIWVKFGAGDTASDWRVQDSRDIPFSSLVSGYKSGSSDVQKALDESRTNKLYVPVDLVTSLNGTTTLDNTSYTLQIFTGTATGHSLVLPDATTINHGSSYLIVNKSTSAVLVKNNSGTLLFTLIADSVAELILEDNPDTDGLWLEIITSASATGIISYVVASSTPFSTSSTTDILITGFTVTPASGRYAAFYSSEIVISANNKVAENVLYKNGVANENTRRKTQGVGSAFESGSQTIGEISVNGSEVVDIRVNVTSGSLNIINRSLVLIRLGS